MVSFSFDVTSLLMNVPLDKIIEIILKEFKRRKK